MSWKDEAEQIERRRARARELGGSQAVERQHARGRLTVRERIAGLADADSFREVGATAGHTEPDAPDAFTPTNVVTGTVRIGGRAATGLRSASRYQDRLSATSARETPSRSQCRSRNTLSPSET